MGSIIDQVRKSLNSLHLGQTSLKTRRALRTFRHHLGHNHSHRVVGPDGPIRGAGPSPRTHTQRFPRAIGFAYRLSEFSHAVSAAALEEVLCSAQCVLHFLCWDSD